MQTFYKTLLGSTALLGLIACSGTDDMAMTDSYTITVTNLSANQPITPVAAVLHNDGYMGWTLGATASTGLEKMAEGGDTTDFIADAMSSTAVTTTQTGTGIILPGGAETLTVNLPADMTASKLTLAAMLANTNDAFIGTSGMDISDLASGMNKTFMLKAMDAGTEANTEAAGTLPGPADGGTGYDITRDDILDKVTIHAGIVSMDDGLSTSVLNETHRWNGAVAKVVVEKM